MRTIVWFRGKDLRIGDHAPLRDAAAAGEVIPLFVLDPYFFAPERAQQLPHRIQFLLDSLRELERAIAGLGSRLLIVPGKSVEVVPRLARTWKADRVLAYRWVEPVGRERDRRIRASLGDAFQLFEGETLLPPGTLRSKAGQPYAIFSQFERVFRDVAAIGKPAGPPRKLPPLPAGVRARTVKVPEPEDLGVPRNPALLAGGERAARARLQRFVRAIAADYEASRERMDLDGTSRLSADLKFGTLSARTVWTTVDERGRGGAGARAFLRQLIWREFAYSTLWDRPHLLERPCRPVFSTFPYRYREAHWRAWVDGTTGYPIVDAAARQLLGEGYVHNRARMISSGFLTKHLLIDYHRGEAHYLKHLTDGDWANNNFGWQWSAGSGCDAQPWFRIWNPTVQGQKHDPTGDYVRRWVPELARLPARFIHRPHEAPPEVLRAAGVTLGETYPRPIVDYHAARDRFMELGRKHLRPNMRLQPIAGAPPAKRAPAAARR